VKNWGKIGEETDRHVDAIDPIMSHAIAMAQTITGANNNIFTALKVLTVIIFCNN